MNFPFSIAWIVNRLMLKRDRYVNKELKKRKEGEGMKEEQRVKRDCR